MSNRHDPLQTPLAILWMLGAVGYWYYGDVFAQELLAEIAIFALFAMSLDLLVGTTGLVSLGHAAFLALGAYATAAFGVFLAWPMSLATLAGALLAGLAALLVGAFAVRLKGVFFIMITLAIGQMFYAYFFKAAAFGKDDGMTGIPRMDLSLIGLDSQNPKSFAALVLIIAVLCYCGLRTVIHSPFGQMLRAIQQNENRLRALGGPVYHYKLAAFVLAGLLAGLAGALLAQHTGYISPDLAFWTVSGEALIMVIAGGRGSLVGAAIGATLIIAMRQRLSAQTEYWGLFMGAFFIAVVVLASDGIYGRLVWLWRRIAGTQ